MTVLFLLLLSQTLERRFKLAAESNVDGSVLKKLGILVDQGRTLNVNKNPIAENAIKEFHKERLRLNPAGGRISEVED